MTLKVKPGEVSPKELKFLMFSMCTFFVMPEWTENEKTRGSELEFLLYSTFSPWSLRTNP